MTLVSRRIASNPKRTSSETWDRIVDLISETGSEARSILNRVQGLAASIIAEETPKEFPIVVAGSGPRLRVYCVYGGDAILGEDCDEDQLTWNPTDGSWHMYIPCLHDDYESVSPSLHSHSTRISAYDITEGIPEEPQRSEQRTKGFPLSVDLEGFFRK